GASASAAVLGIGPDIHFATIRRVAVAVPEPEVAGASDERARGGAPVHPVARGIRATDVAAKVAVQRIVEHVRLASERSGRRIAVAVCMSKGAPALAAPAADARPAGVPADSAVRRVLANVRFAPVPVEPVAVGPRVDAMACTRRAGQVEPDFT